MHSIIDDEIMKKKSMPHPPNSPKCVKCNKKTMHVEWTEIAELPQFLVLNLKRYKKMNSNARDVGTRITCDEMIEVPIGTKQRRHFHLRSVICHFGVSNSNGHYKCYVLERLGSDTLFHVLDDDKHCSITKNQFIKETDFCGYIYLYSEKEPCSFEENPYEYQKESFAILQETFRKSTVFRNLPRNAKAPRKSMNHSLTLNDVLSSPHVKQSSIEKEPMITDAGSKKRKLLKKEIEGSPRKLRNGKCRKTNPK